MTENTLIIRWNHTQADSFCCYSKSDAMGIESDLDNLAVIVNRVLPSRIVVYVPGEYVYTTYAHIPVKQRQKVMQMVPYALEEQLAEDIDLLHFAVSKKPDPEGFKVMVVSHLLMQQWMETLQKAGIKVDAIYPDYLGIPKGENQKSIFYQDGKAYIRYGDALGQVISTDLLTHSKIELDAFQQYTIADNPQQSIDASSYDSEAQLWLQGIKDLPSFSLLQGNYSKSEQIGRHLMVWRLAASLLIVWLSILFSADVIEYQRLTAKDHYLQQQIVAVYKDAFPRATKIVNPHVQMEQYLKKTATQTSDIDFNKLLLDSAAVIKKVNNVEFKSIRYKRKRLEIELTLKSLAELDQIKQQLLSNGLNMNIQSANSKGGTVESRISIERGV
jgi:general secretion pathway protein L